MIPDASLIRCYCCSIHRLSTEQGLTRQADEQHGTWYTRYHGRQFGSTIDREPLRNLLLYQVPGSR